MTGATVTMSGCLAAIMASAMSCSGRIKDLKGMLPGQGMSVGERTKDDNSRLRRLENLPFAVVRSFSSTATHCSTVASIQCRYSDSMTMRSGLFAFIAQAEDGLWFHSGSAGSAQLFTNALWTLMASQRLPSTTFSKPPLNQSPVAEMPNTKVQVKGPLGPLPGAGGGVVPSPGGGMTGGGVVSPEGGVVAGGVGEGGAVPVVGGVVDGGVTSPPGGGVGG